MKYIGSTGDLPLNVSIICVYFIFFRPSIRATDFRIAAYVCFQAAMHNGIHTHQTDLRDSESTYYLNKGMCSAGRNFDLSKYSCVLNQLDTYFCSLSSVPWVTGLDVVHSHWSFSFLTTAKLYACFYTFHTA